MAPPPDDVPPTAPYPSPVGDAPTLSGPPPAPADDTPPDAGRYQPVRFHRRGGMGRVFVARDTELNRDVALKDIQPKHAEHPTVRRLFEFEARVTGTLEHPGVVPVYGMGRCPGDRPFYAMRFIHGQSLAEAIRDYHAAPPDPSRAVERAAALRNLLSRFLAVCQTVAYAHSRGIIHRDLKPQNVMLGPFGETIVLDWGLAKRVAAADAADEPAAAPAPSPVDAWGETRTLPGARLGTAAYWAPEQARGEPDRHDERTDVYGLGAILFEILTGEPPNAGGVPCAVAPSPRDRGAAVDDEIDEIVRTALAPDPDDRQPSAADLARQVDWWLGEQPVAGQRAAVRALEQEFERNPDRRDLGDQLARQRANLGLMYRALDRPMRAAVAFAYAVRWYESLAAGGRAHPRDLAELANCRVLLAECFEAMGLADQAAEERQGARALFDRLIAAHPDEYRANFATLILSRSPAAPPEPERPVEDRTAELGPAEAARAREPAGEAELIQGYTVLRPLGEGALGRVLLARDNALDRLVAVKDFRADLPDDARRRAVREMQVTAKLVHPHIVRVYTYGVHAADRRPFMVMEYIPGQTLRDELAAFHRVRRRPAEFGPALTRLVAAVAQAAEAIHFAHTQGVLHRDPKPSNVMVTEDGRTVVIDWGLAKVIGAAEVPAGDTAHPADPALTATGAVLGTPAYMAPERAKGETGTDPGYRGDIYSLGAGLYEVLTGTVPFTGPAVVDVLRKVLFEAPKAPRAVNPDVPAELEAVCAAAMAYRPEDRYPTAAALAEDLRAWLAGKPLAVRHRGRLRKLWDQLAGRR